jgi:hypothetical protein
MWTSGYLHLVELGGCDPFLQVIRLLRISQSSAEHPPFQIAARIYLWIHSQIKTVQEQWWTDQSSRSEKKFMRSADTALPLSMVLVY